MLSAVLSDGFCALGWKSVVSKDSGSAAGAAGDALLLHHMRAAMLPASADFSSGVQSRACKHSRNKNVKGVEKSQPPTESPGEAYARAIPVTAALSAETALMCRKRTCGGTQRGSTGEMAYGMSEGGLGREGWCWDL